ncbi:putative type II restriction endonuclease [Alkalibacterium sp. AK22]|uniref:hypothetical protein n=1 Tax=Alkalibacterium sp. AK22 TaxID=1229520 RepID=UPI000445E363|nr:hypothetical protein [Alkalibacterium sp. AK22]EXJ24412.1 putative type II restriction endonuclease [Alkalibacterium sp. AK22]
MDQILTDALIIKNNISNSVPRLSIYDELTPIDSDYWIKTEELEALLNYSLKGKSYEGLAARTRSKRINEDICLSMGYPVPKSFKKVKPRFPSQNFDKYAQKSRNLQIWNDKITPTRRYVILILSEDYTVVRVKILSGDQLQKFDTTGTLTSKYQASYRQVVKNEAVLLSPTDSIGLNPYTNDIIPSLYGISPAANPLADTLLNIEKVFEKLSTIVNKRIPFETGNERINGQGLHELVCKALGYSVFEEDGSLPDIKNQLLEVKLQTSPTIDLGLFLPNQDDLLEILPLNSRYAPKIKDIRYAIFYAEPTADGKEAIIRSLLLVSGEEFFTYFRQFEGKGINKKLQLPISKVLWSKDDEEVKEYFVDKSSI